MSATYTCEHGHRYVAPTSGAPFPACPTCEEEERDVEALAEAALLRWRGGAYLSTLDLRAACHAAARVGDAAVERAIAGEVADREARGDG